MVFNLSDLDELCLNVINDESRQKFKEAVICYNSGAYSSAVIVCWISLCIDIISKIQELSIAGDPEAKKIDKIHNEILNISNSDIDKKIVRSQKFENNILKYACENLQLISPAQKEHLRLLQKDRHRCAHPTFSDCGQQYQPLPEQVRSHIANVATYVLIHIPTRGKIFVDDIFDKICSLSFPTDFDKAYQYLSSERYLGKAKNSCVTNLLIRLLKRFFTKNESDVDLEIFKRIMAAMLAISKINKELYGNVLPTKLNHILSSASDSILKRFFLFLIDIDDYLNCIEESILINLNGIISNTNVRDFKRYKLLNCASKHNLFREQILSRFEEFNDKEQENIMNITPSELTKEKAIKRFIESNSFNDANEYGVSLILPHARYFDINNIQEILNGVYENDQIWGAYETKELLTSLYDETKMIFATSQDQFNSVWINFSQAINQSKAVSRVGLFDVLEEKLREDNLI
ncbi:hypothetical protein L3V83_13125 [Thiotrichales bacterium 19X7-9]|nr:hypothetical protein [Thiotrichales bacterium 19X7-9]